MMMQDMRTTLDIDADILEAAKEMAKKTKKTAGQVLSDLARKSLVASQSLETSEVHYANGFEVMASNGRVVTDELVRKLLEESEAS